MSRPNPAELDRQVGLEPRTAQSHGIENGPQETEGFSLPASEMNLGPWQEKPYGQRADGFVESDGRRIPITVREPLGWSGEINGTEVEASGWTARGNSMRHSAIAATAFGNRAITFDYTNTSLAEALESNVADLVSVITAAAQESSRISGTGLSMGGSVFVRALGHIGSMLETVNLVAPGQYVDSSHYSPWGIARHLLTEGQEFLDVGRSRPLDTFYLGLSGAKNCLRRRLGVIGEIRDLLGHTVHEEHRQAKARPNAPYLRIVKMIDDRLIPYPELSEVADELPFDDRVAARGHHARWAYDLALPSQIFRRHANKNDQAEPQAA